MMMMMMMVDGAEPIFRLFSIPYGILYVYSIYIAGRPATMENPFGTMGISIDEPLEYNQHNNGYSTDHTHIQMSKIFLNLFLGRIDSGSRRFSSHCCAHTQRDSHQNGQVFFSPKANSYSGYTLKTKSNNF
jgi:hypothetical protein